MEGAPAVEEPRDRYVGSRNQDGLAEGQGKLTYANGEYYEGQFLNDQQDGFGTHKWPSGAEYVGEWIAGVRQGLGKYTFPDGATFTGRFKGEKDGSIVREGARGEYSWINGEAYRGGFKADQREGKGIFVWSSGRSDLCTFSKGLPKGEGVRWSADRQTAWRLVDGKQLEEMDLATAEAERAAFEEACEAACAKEQAAADKAAADRAAKLAKEAAKKNKKKKR